MENYDKQSLTSPGADPEDGGGGGTSVLCCAIGIAHNPLGGSGDMLPQKIFQF